MKKHSYLVYTSFLVLVIVCLPLLLSCAPGEQGTGSAGTKTLKIGMISWLSGSPGVDWGKQIKALEAAANKKGGITVGSEKYLINVIQYDTNNQMDSAMASANRLIFEDKVKFIIGESFCDAWAPLCEENKVITSALANGAMIFKPEFKYTFMPCFTTSTQHLALAWYVSKYPNQKNWMLVLPDHQFGHIMGDIFTNELKRDFKINATVEYYPPAQQDLSAIGTKIKNANPDLVMAFEMLALKAVWQAGYKGQFFTPVNYTADYIISMAGAQAAEGYIGIAGPTEFEPALTESAKAFKVAFTDKFGKWEDKDMQGTAYYTAVIAAIEKAGTLDTDKVAAVFGGGLKWDSPNGTIQMVSRPDLGIKTTVDSVSTLYIKTIKNGKAALVDTIPLDKGLTEYNSFIASLKPAGQPSGPIPSGEVTVEWKDAKSKVGYSAVITANVFDVLTIMPPQAMILLGAGMGQGVGVVIPDTKKWPVDPTTYKGKTVTVKGKIEANPFDGGPQITLTDPSQITVK